MASNIRVTASGYALEWLANNGFDPHYGARPVKRVIQKYILNELSKQILTGKIRKDSEMIIDMFNNKLVFRNPDREGE